MAKNEAKILAADIRAFLEKYGKRDATFPEEWNSPDAYEMERCAALLDGGLNLPVVPHSSWESSGYGPYLSKEGRREHDALVKRCSLASKKGPDGKE